MAYQSFILKMFGAVFFLFILMCDIKADDEPFVIEKPANGATQDDINVDAISIMETFEKNRLRKGTDDYIKNNNIKNPGLNWTSNSAIIQWGLKKLAVIDVRALYPSGDVSNKYLTIIGLNGKSEVRVICSTVGNASLSLHHGKCGEKIYSLYGKPSQLSNMR